MAAALVATAVFTVSDATGTVSLSGATTDVLCFGQNTGAIDLSAGGGAAPYTFSWLPGIPGNPEDPAGLPAGNYTVLVTDMAGCTATASFTVGQPAAAVQLVCSQSSNVSFPGATDGAAAIDISGGVAPYSVVWSPGTSQANLGAGVFSIGNLGVDNYAVTVTDANGCPAVCAFTISIIKCETALGTMPGNLQALCGDGCQSANYNPAGQYLEPGDVLQFILHEGAGAQIVNEIARNNLPSFCFDPTLINYGTVYYISAAAGNNDGAGNVLLSHFCTVVAPGTPVVFYDIPVAGVVPPGPLNCVVDEVSLPGSSSLPGAS
ncbi:MAG: SprB repeat-containing protein [Saprospirales bacterium]|nr:SprB repeat-containing protein [Saprospirales bacterium]